MRSLFEIHVANLAFASMVTMSCSQKLRDEAHESYDRTRNKLNFR